MLSFLTTVKDARRRSDPFCRLLPARSASPRAGHFGRRARQVKAAQEDEGKGRGALVLALTPCYTGDPAREARMERIHEGILYQDQHKRYCLYEPDVPEQKTLTCTSGCRLEVWLNRIWIGFPCRGRRRKLLVFR